MKRDYHIAPDGTFEFNSEDTVGHPWGDFVLSYGRNVRLTIDGNYYEINNKGSWIFFHRDKDGVIDHLVPCGPPPKFDRTTEDECPVCKSL